MIDDELEQDDMDAMDDEDGVPESFNAGPDSDEPEDVNEQDEISTSSKKGAGKPVPELEELPSIEAKQKDRDELERAMQEFLARGGKIQSVDSEKI